MYISEENNTFCLHEGAAHAVTCLNAPSVLENGLRTELPILFEEGSRACYGNERDRVELTVEDRGDGLFYIHQSWQNISAQERLIQTVFGVTACFQVNQYLIPCVSINGNPFGNGCEPKGLEHDGEAWAFAYDRVGIPSCTLVENEEYAVSLFASDESPASLISSCSVRQNKKTKAFIQEIYHPAVESPVSYSSRDEYSAPRTDSIFLRSGERFEVGMFLLISKPRWRNFGICKSLDAALQLFGREAQPLPDLKTVWDRSIAFAKSLLSDYKGRKGFIIGFLPNDDGGFSYREDACFELAWCGQNVLLSRMLIKDYLLNGHADSLRDALEVLDTRVQNCVSSKGLLSARLKDFEHLESSISDACNMGYGAYEFLRTYALLQEMGIDKPEYLQAGLGVCDFFCMHFSDVYGFGKAWRLDGVCEEHEGSIGGFLIPAFAKAYELTKNEAYLFMAETAMRFYMERDLNRFCCTAGALDTCCVDKETSAPFLMGAILLYELTGKAVYLEYGEKAAYYFTSWMFHYQPCYAEGDDIARYGVQLRGLTAVSAQHHHLDMYAGILVPYLRKLARYTNNECWKTRADWMWAAVLQMIGDGEWSIHKRVRPVGSQNEAIFQCAWSFHGSKRGALNDWLVAWPCAFRLSVLAEEL